MKLSQFRAVGGSNLWGKGSNIIKSMKYLKMVILLWGKKVRFTYELRILGGVQPPAPSPPRLRGTEGQRMADSAMEQMEPELFRCF